MANGANLGDEEWQRIVQGSCNGPTSKSLTEVCFNWDPNTELSADYSELIDEYIGAGSYSSTPADAAYFQDTILPNQSMVQSEVPSKSFKVPSAQYIGNVARGQLQTAFASNDAVMDEPVSRRPYSPVTLPGSVNLPNVAGANLSGRVEKLELELEDNKEMVRTMKAYLLALKSWVDETHDVTDELWDWQRLTESAWSSAAEPNDTVPAKSCVQKIQQLVRVKPQWVEEGGLRDKRLDPLS